VHADNERHPEPSSRTNAEVDALKKKRCCEESPFAVKSQGRKTTGESADAKAMSALAMTETRVAITLVITVVDPLHP
jgi:hypothetical protein